MSARSDLLRVADMLSDPSKVVLDTEHLYEDDAGNPLPHSSPISAIKRVCFLGAFFVTIPHQHEAMLDLIRPHLPMERGAGVRTFVGTFEERGAQFCADLVRRVAETLPTEEDK